MVQRCDRTLEMFTTTPRGRPRTSSVEKRRQDNARRQRKYRARQRVIKQVVAMIAEQHSLNSTVVQFLQYLHHPLDPLPFTEAPVRCKNANGTFRAQLSPEEIERQMLEGAEIEFE